jgi:hypothetical protein
MKSCLPLRATIFLLAALIALGIRFVQMLCEGKAVGEASNPPENKLEMTD